jgi:hypothetical protein
MSTTRAGAAGGTSEQRHTAVSPPGGRLRAAWHAVLGALGTLVGLAPHVLHHIGLLAGTAWSPAQPGPLFSVYSGWSPPSRCCCG